MLPQLGGAGTGALGGGREGLDIGTFEGGRNEPD